MIIPADWIVKMFIKIGNLQFVKSDYVDWVVTLYGSTSIGIRAYAQSPDVIKAEEEKLYKLREGRTQEVEISTEDGSTINGRYKINELNWKKESDLNGEFRLLFNIGLQKDTTSSDN